MGNKVVGPCTRIGQPGLSGLCLVAVNGRLIVRTGTEKPDPESDVISILFPSAGLDVIDPRTINLSENIWITFGEGAFDGQPRPVMKGGFTEHIFKYNPEVILPVRDFNLERRDVILAVFTDQLVKEAPFQIVVPDQFVVFKTGQREVLEAFESVFDHPTSLEAMTPRERAQTCAAELVTLLGDVIDHTPELDRLAELKVETNEKLDQANQKLDQLIQQTDELEPQKETTNEKLDELIELLTKCIKKKKRTPTPYPSESSSEENTPKHYKKHRHKKRHHH